MSFFQQLKQAWEALDYADVGEFLPYAEKCRILGVKPPPIDYGYLPPLDAETRRAVALNLGRDLSWVAINYAIGMAQRLEANLILLYPPNSPAPEAIIAEMQMRITAAGIDYQEATLIAPWNESVFTFLRHHSEVICLIIEPSDLDPKILASNSLEKRHWSIPAPVVVVHGESPLPQAI